MLAAQGAAAAKVQPPARAVTDKPNFVMLFVDDLGYGDVAFNGHPTTHTPNLDKLAFGGKVLTTWYSGCHVCSGSRGALMTGRQFVRLGIPGVFSPTTDEGLPLNETTVANQMKKAGYRTAMMGKWHLGQRPMFLPAARGFDRYLGIPYSDDMGNAQKQPSCSGSDLPETAEEEEDTWQQYVDAGLTSPRDVRSGKGGAYLPLVHQIDNTTTVEEQPLQFRTLAQKYSDYVVGAINDFKADPFFLYMPFSHVHTTSNSQPEKQYAGCAFENTTKRGKFGDALNEVDWIVGNVISTLETNSLSAHTLVIFASDNGPWMVQGKSGGSTGLLYGRHAGYWNVGKGSTWEGGIREPAFVYWPGQITAGTRASEVVSSLDLLPTLSKLAGVDLPVGTFYDGKDASDVWLKDDGKSPHDFLFFYKNNNQPPSAARHGPYKAHWKTGPGLGGCKPNCSTITYPDDAPLLFNIEEDPSEAYPLSDKDLAAAFYAALKKENSEMVFGKLVAPPPEKGETPGDWGICCDHSKNCDCSP